MSAARDRLQAFKVQKEWEDREHEEMQQWRKKEEEELEKMAWAEEEFERMDAEAAAAVDRQWEAKKERELEADAEAESLQEEIAALKAEDERRQKACEQ
jgi:hypothetical protein